MSSIGDPRLPIVSDKPTYAADLNYRLSRVLREIGSQLNALSEGQLVASYSAAAAAPTTGTYAAGDVIRNSAPGVLGTAGSQYVITGWVNVVSGTPGTWVQMRSLTGS